MNTQIYVAGSKIPYKCPCGSNEFRTVAPEVFDCASCYRHYESAHTDVKAITEDYPTEIADLKESLKKLIKSNQTMYVDTCMLYEALIAIGERCDVELTRIQATDTPPVAPLKVYTIAHDVLTEIIDRVHSATVDRLDVEERNSDYAKEACSEASEETSASSQAST